MMSIFELFNVGNGRNRPNRHTHTHTQTKYCNPPAHAPRVNYICMAMYFSSLYAWNGYIFNAALLHTIIGLKNDIWIVYTKIIVECYACIDIYTAYFVFVCASTVRLRILLLQHC